MSPWWKDQQQKNKEVENANVMDVVHCDGGVNVHATEKRNEHDDSETSNLVFKYYRLYWCCLDDYF